MSIVGSAKHDIGQAPKASRDLHWGDRLRRKGHWRQEKPLHEGWLLWRPMRNGVGIEAELFYFAAGAAIVGRVCGVGKKKFGLTLR